MEEKYKEIKDLLYKLGLTANYKLPRILLCFLCHSVDHRKRGTVTAGDKVAVSGGGEAIWDKLESGGAEHTNGGRNHVARELGAAGGTGGQAAGGTAADGAVAGHPCGSGKKRRAASRTFTARNGGDIGENQTRLRPLTAARMVSGSMAFLSI